MQGMGHENLTLNLSLNLLELWGRGKIRGKKCEKKGAMCGCVDSWIRSSEGLNDQIQ